MRWFSGVLQLAGCISQCNCCNRKASASSFGGNLILMLATPGLPFLRAAAIALGERRLSDGCSEQRMVLGQPRQEKTTARQKTSADQKRRQTKNHRTEKHKTTKTPDKKPPTKERKIKKAMRQKSPYKNQQTKMLDKDTVPQNHRAKSIRQKIAAKQITRRKTLGEKRRTKKHRTNNAGQTARKTPG